MTASDSDTLTDKAVAAMRAAVAKVVEDHRQRGKPLAIWRNGRVVLEVPPAADSVRESSGDYEAGERDGEGA